MKRGLLLLLRRLRLMHVLDKIKFFQQKQKNARANTQFKRQYPQVAIPPDYILFESHQLNYQAYYNDGKESASNIASAITKYKGSTNLRILDWGCGPARIVRHLPEILEDSCEIHGTDYNLSTIQWCSKNIKKVSFNHNQISPPTSYPNSHFDFIYGLSIFTHLSEENHKNWYEELIRISKPGGMLYLTTHGNACKVKLSASEQTQFESGKLVVRGKVKEGHRVYATYHPPKYMAQLFGSKSEVIEHIEGKQASWGIEQDVWILKKPN